jgi:hypothetical protein
MPFSLRVVWNNTEARIVMSEPAGNAGCEPVATAGADLIAGNDDTSIEYREEMDN